MSNQPAAKCLRYEEYEQMGCAVCGTAAQWVDSPQSEDYWSLPCGHLRDNVIRTRVITTTTRAAS